MYTFDIVFLKYHDEIYYDNYEMIELLFNEQHLHKKFYLLTLHLC